MLKIGYVWIVVQCGIFMVSVVQYFKLICVRNCNCAPHSNKDRPLVSHGGATLCLVPGILCVKLKGENR